MAGQCCVEEEHVQFQMLALAPLLAVQLGTFYTGQWSFLGEGKRSYFIIQGLHSAAHNPQ